MKRLWVVILMILFLMAGLGARSKDNVDCIVETNFGCGQTPEPGTVPIVPTAPSFNFHVYIPYLVSDDGK